MLGEYAQFTDVGDEFCKVANMAIGKLYIGRKVRDLRQTTGATQAQFAERIGISISYLNQIENNQRPVSAAVRLRRGVPPRRCAGTLGLAHASRQ